MKNEGIENEKKNGKGMITTMYTYTAVQIVFFSISSVRQPHYVFIYSFEKKKRVNANMRLHCCFDSYTHTSEQ